MSMTIRTPLFVFYLYWAVTLAGQLVGAAKTKGALTTRASGRGANAVAPWHSLTYGPAQRSSPDA
jgi:hypothetical protein